jgi:DNA-binding beta-propeller fold protein YncE
MPKLPYEKPDLVLGNGSAGSEDHQLYCPMGIAYVPAHLTLMLITSYFSHQVRLYNTDTGKLLFKMGKDGGEEGTGEGEFDGPDGITVTTDSKFVVVAEPDNHRLQVLRLVVSADECTAKLEFVRFIGEKQLRCPSAVVSRKLKGSEETLLIADSDDNCISEFNLQGEFLGSFGEPGSGEGQLNSPMDIDVLPSGEVIVADQDNHRVCVFTTGGKFRFAFGSQGTESDGKFGYASAVTSDTQGNMYVLDVDSSRLQVFDVNGKHLATRTNMGINSNDVKDIECRPDGALFIANGNKNTAFHWRGPVRF